MAIALEARLIDIETKLAHQDDTINTLNDVVSSQRQQIHHLERAVKVLVDRVRQLNSGAADNSMIDEQPPHY